MRRAILLVLVLISVAGAQSKQTGEDPGTRVINYEVDGSVHSAFLTYRDAGGVTRQEYVDLPYKEQFFAPYGAFVYLSAQKRARGIDDGRSGKLHVLVRVGGVPFRESETEAAFGIATASGKVAQY
jgi:hypothetical protein